MRRIIGVIALALILVTGNFTAASAATTNGSSDDGRTRTLHILARTIDSTELDLGAPGPSLGDQFVFTDDLLQDGRSVGTDHGTCTVTRITGTAPSRTVTDQCLVTLVLERGQITVQGAAAFPEQGMPALFALAVTGGTGAYRTAHREVLVRILNETDADLTVRLIL
jgi:hypothetical protein